MPLASPLVPATGALTRRRFLGAAGLSVLLTVPACAERPGSAPAPQASRTFDGAFGPAEVPVAPQRVASTDFYTAYALLDVGFTVAATVEATVGGVFPEYRRRTTPSPRSGRRRTSTSRPSSPRNRISSSAPSSRACPRT